MSWKNIKEITDFEFCPKFWAIMREKRDHVFDSQQLIEIHERLKYSPDQEKIGLKISIFIIVFISIIVFLNDNPQLISLFYILLIIIATTIVFCRKRKKETKSKKTSQDRILLNPSTSNADLNIYAKNIKFHRKGKQFYVYLDRPNTSLPSYASYAIHTDLIELTGHMYIIKMYYLTDKIEGVINYKSGQKKLNWPKDKRNNRFKRTRELIDGFKVKKSIERIKSINRAIKDYNDKKSINVHFTRCNKCSLNQKCSYARSLPKFTIQDGDGENVKKTYLQFKQMISIFERTTWNHWDKQVRDLANLIQSSAVIGKYIRKQRLLVEMFDVDQLIETAIFNKKRICNGNFSSARRKMDFSLQLFLYLSEKGRKKKLKSLMPFYGQTEGEDKKTSNDIKIRNFMNKEIAQDFLYYAGAYLEEFLEENNKDEKAPNHFRFIIKNNHGTINNPTIQLFMDEVK